MSIHNLILTLTNLQMGRPLTAVLSFDTTALLPLKQIIRETANDTSVSSQLAYNRAEKMVDILKESLKENKLDLKATIKKDTRKEETQKKDTRKEETQKKGRMLLKMENNENRNTLNRSQSIVGKIEEQEKRKAGIIFQERGAISQLLRPEYHKRADVKQTLPNRKDHQLQISLQAQYNVPVKPSKLKQLILEAQSDSSLSPITQDRQAQTDNSLQGQYKEIFPQEIQRDIPPRTIYDRRVYNTDQSEIVEEEPWECEEEEIQDQIRKLNLQLEGGQVTPNRSITQNRSITSNRSITPSRRNTRITPVEHVETKTVRLSLTPKGKKARKVFQECEEQRRPARWQKKSLLSIQIQRRGGQ